MMKLEKIPFAYKDVKINRNIIHDIRFERPLIIPPDIYIFDNCISVTHNMALEMARQVDAKILKMLYDKYKETAVDQVIVLDETEFKNFLNIFLPKYIEMISED